MGRLDETVITIWEKGQIEKVRKGEGDAREKSE